MAQVLLNETTPNGGDLDANFTELYNKKAWSTTGIGYATGDGAGGTVTQATSKSTSVTLNRLTGQITMNSAALAANAAVTFSLTNSFIASTDVVIVNVINSVSGPANYTCSVSGLAAGAINITLRNMSGGSLSDAVVLGFVVVKAATN